MKAGSRGRGMEKNRVKALQRKAEKFFYNHILRELKEQFQEFINDQVSAQFLDEKTKRLIEDLINSIGKVKIDTLKAIKYFCDNENLFHQIIQCLQDVPQIDKIQAMFSSSNMSTRYFIPLTLRPHGAENMSSRHTQADPITTSIIMEVLSRWLSFAEEKERTLSLLAEELGKIKENEFEHYTALPAIISEMKEHILAYSELIIILEDTVNKTIAHPEMRPTLKRYFWEKVIIQSIELINDFCHDITCVKGCVVIHDLTIRKTAELLKIIYPDHFTEEISQVAAGIKARYLEIRYAKNETDVFIRQLYSRYSEDQGRFIRVEKTVEEPVADETSKVVQEETAAKQELPGDFGEELTAMEIEAGSIKDPVTGLHSKRFLIDAGNALYATAMRNKFNVAVFMVGIDGFGDISNAYGGNAGDVVAKKYGNILKKIFKRRSDVVTRIADDVFCVVTSYDSVERLDSFTDRLKNQMEHLAVTHKGSDISCSTSVGVCRQPLDSFEKMVEYADAMMHKAKESEDQTIYAEDGSVSGQVLSFEPKKSRIDSGA